MSERSSGALTGVRVLDLTRLLPGGFATALLSDLGAEVVKIEQPRIGDYMRWKEPRYGGTSAQSWITDRGKRSLAIDLKNPRGADAFKRLIADADLLVESFRPGVMARLGLGYEDVRDLNPRLVYCSISGYGQDGPAAQEAGHDINYIGRAGVLSITGTADRPAIPGVQVADLGGGALMSLVGMLSALVHARVTGEGDHVDVSMTDGAFAWLSVQLGIHFATGKSPGREAVLLNGGFPCYNVYECADGRWLTVGAIEDQFFKALCDGVGRPDLVPTHMDPEAVGTWRALFLQQPRDEWLNLLAGTDACVGPVNDFAEAAADPQLRHRRMVVETEDAGGERRRQLGPPIKLLNRPPAVHSPPPRLGEHTEAYLSEAGIRRDELAGLLRDGVAEAPEQSSAVP
ncbi:MAG: CaiB/BaiF CoA-transferase family protein [Thermoleophilaceae bacterium]